MRNRLLYIYPKKIDNMKSKIEDYIRDFAQKT